MDDAISRQQAIDALKGLPTWWADEGGYYGGAQPPMVALLDPEDAVSAIENLPSAQPDLQPTCNKLATDTISRQAAIDAANRADYRGLTVEDVKKVTDEVVKELKQLPSAQSEVVRCKDCKHVRRWRSKEAELKFGQIYDCAYGVFLAPRAEDFCSHAERRSDD